MGPAGTSAGLTPRDRAQLARRGIAPEEVERQLALLRDPPPPARLARPCVPGDGILRLEPAVFPSLLAHHGQAADDGRLIKMVPASGAASRMFQALVATRDGGGDRAAKAAVERVERELERLPFAAALPPAARRDRRALLDALLLDEAHGGLDLPALPKGLIPFHRYRGGRCRTAFEEHLVEGAAYLRDRRGRCRFHFTVPPGRRQAFVRKLEGPARVWAEAEGVELAVGFSTQSPATDTVALDRDGALFRRHDGRLLLRPGGHGALLGNLSQLAEDDGGDIVLLKNIDNVVPEHLQDEVVLWQRLLAGHLLRLQERIFAVLRRLDAPAASADAKGGTDDDRWLDDALGFVASAFGAAEAAPLLRADTAAKRAFLLRRLHRPLRVCAMVPNEGEPGGGPFWVRGAGGEVTPQIVEAAQIDRADPEQAAILAAATHFNPVALACALRDHRGRAYDLPAFRDPRAVFIAEKSEGGRPLRALEHPGLWNGAMARWNTVFVEVPAATFAPVKTVLDLLRPQHQPPIEEEPT